MLALPGASRFTKLRQDEIHYKTLTRLRLRNADGAETKFSCKAKKWYCGQRYAEAGKCKCGGCDGVCGPTNGCPCDHCAEIELKYCGKEFCTRGQCYCGSCDGRCGPTNGCPCPDCILRGNLLPAVYRLDRSRTVLYPADDVFTTVLLAISKLSFSSCPEGHQTFALKRAPPSFDSSNNAQLMCVECSMPIAGRLAHCALCKYNLCRNCELSKFGALIVPRVTCSAKHPLMTLFEKPQGYIGNTKCSACLQLIDYDDGFFHCKKCSYDLCQQCESNTFRQLKAPWPDRLRCPCGQHAGKVAFTHREDSNNNMMCCQCEDAIRVNDGFMFADCCQTSAICFNCARQFVRKSLSDCKLQCPSEHQMKAFCSSKPSINLCDACGESIIYKNGYLRCDPCDYDLCSVCAFKAGAAEEEEQKRKQECKNTADRAQDGDDDGLDKTCAKPEQLRREYDSYLDTVGNPPLTDSGSDPVEPAPAAEPAAAASSAERIPVEVAMQQVVSAPAVSENRSNDAEVFDEVDASVAQTVRQVRLPPTMRHAQPACVVEASDGNSSPIQNSARSEPGKPESEPVPLHVRVVYENEEFVIPAHDVSSLDSLRQTVSEMISKVEGAIVHPDAILLDVVENGECSPLHLPRRFTEAFKKLDQENPVLRVIATLENCPIQEWDRLEPLGKGTFGTVFKAINRDGFMFAAKEIELSHIARQSSGYEGGDVSGGHGNSSTTSRESRSELLALQAEIRLVRQLKHPNLIEYYGSCEADDNKFYILMEYVAGGSLAKLIAGHKPSLSQVQSFAKQLLSGLSFLHRFSVVHRDVKPDNIMLSNTGTLKIVDFGTAKHLGATTASTTDARGTPLYMAPEIISASGCRTSCDIWSVGCTVVEMITQKRPFSELGRLNQCQLMYKIAVEKRIPAWPRDLSPSLNDFLEQCFKLEPKERPSAIELLSHVFLVEQF